MKKILLMAIAAVMAMSAFAQETVKKVRVYKEGAVAYEEKYDAVDSIVFVDIEIPAVPEGALSGKFTINADGDQIQFSQGNLQATYNGSAWTWSFAANQYDYIGNATANTSINGNGTVSANGTVDLFGWSTSATYYGIHNSTSSSTYSGDFVDWGTNAISNGGNKASLWRTLTSAEWNYLCSSRSNAENLCGQATVAGVYGFVFLPDNWSTPSSLTWQGNPNNWTTNQYSVTDWSKMEAAGAVFLPAAGRRDGTDVGGVGSYGYSWSSTPYGEYGACNVLFGSSSLNPQGSRDRYYGISVRLVR